jgi:hypothetical protein
MAGSPGAFCERSLPGIGVEKKYSTEAREIPEIPVSGLSG